MRTQMFSGVLFAGIVTIALAAVPLSAQMDHGQMHGATQGGMQHGAMMASTDQMMKNIDQMMSSSASMMRDLTGMQAGMPGNGQGQMTTTMQGMLDNMKQMHGQLKHDEGPDGDGKRPGDEGLSAGVQEPRADGVVLPIHDEERDVDDEGDDGLREEVATSGVALVSGTFGGDQTTTIIYAPAVLRLDTDRFEFAGFFPLPNRRGAASASGNSVWPIRPRPAVQLGTGNGRRLPYSGRVSMLVQ